MTGWLRAMAIAIALAGVIDPHLTRSRPRPAAVDVLTFASPSDPDGAAAARLKQSLAARLEGEIQVGAGPPAAVVTIGAAVNPDVIRDGVPVAMVTLEPGGRNVEVAGVRAPRAVVPGQRASVTIALRARGARGETSTIVLERDGLELARTTHRWTADDERASVAVTGAVPESGLLRLRARALPLDGEVTAADNVSDVGLRAPERRLRVLAWEPRPSWTATFVRRALEGDARFEVASLVRSSRGVETRSGAAPPAPTAAALAGFDAVIVGAPEELTRADVGALDAYVHDRGGAAIFLPDRLPAGPYRRLLPASAFDERLLDRPAALAPAVRGEVRGSEFALPTGARGEALLSLTLAGGHHPAVVSWPSGEGQIVFSGALDAWRFRGGDTDPFAAFWSATVAGIALESPAPLTVSVEPPLAAPGDTVTVRARLRASELSRAPAGVRVPSVRAELAPASRASEPTVVRLWPSATPGSYEGTLRAPAAGRFDVRVSGGGGLTAAAALLVSSDARTARYSPPPPWLARATGGVAADGSDLTAVEDFLRRLPRPAVQVELHPMRSAWWIVPFTLALCAEWALRRRKGLR
jgi:hypothetical protein